MATIGVMGKETKPPTTSPGLTPESRPAASDPLKLVLLMLPPTSTPAVGGSAASAGLTETASASTQHDAILMKKALPIVTGPRDGRQTLGVTNLRTPLEA